MMGGRHPIGQLAQISNVLQQAAAAAERVFEFMDEAEEMADTDDPVTLPAVQGHVESRGFSVVRDFVGHGIGTQMHEEPQVPNYGDPGRGYRLLPGMVLAIEPMVNAGKHFVKVLSDNWTVVTTDGSFSAHFEHSVAVTDNGPWILSQPQSSGGEGA